MPERISTTVDGHRLALTHLDKVWWPETGYTKGQALDYYARVAPVLLPHVSGRPVSFIRFPHGVGDTRFYNKHLPAGTPAWVSTIEVVGKGETRRQVDVNSLATLMWAANLSAIEMHVPQWRTDPEGHDRLVLDLDPGPGAGLRECREVAVLARDLLARDGLTCVVKTSGSKGLHLYAAIEPASNKAVSGYAKALAVRLEAEHPALVVHRMAKELRADHVFVDWSQNSTAKTTAAPYTLRAQPEPTVSTPVTWAEIESDTELNFGPDDVLTRIEREGDLLAALLDPDTTGRLPDD
ncbi:non-homologous end-joining DNA ligase [Streptomyces sp. SID3343]|uniref:non-homologous end-joining DNA ligase n=1 Tax=Streptomyces sp. SID3343 TaxID=2690260 RepID=UPI001371F7C2|nr:non-homologous end-joining DNA ligase [Streptomyces sp. SID3343]MYW05015.1 ATP-dependent DNA ligase [Streptomyces sp. SID3343]